MAWGAVLILIYVGSSPLADAQAPSSSLARANPRITLRMYNHGISRALLIRSEGEATAIFNQAGLAVNWVDCPLTTAELDHYPACQKPMGSADFTVQIVSARRARQFRAQHDALGVALDCLSDDIGCSAYVFSRDVVALARDEDVSESQLLGHVMAHEIGHLLLGPDSHAASGVMRAHWYQQDLLTIAKTHLFFNDQQSLRLRLEASQRNALQ